MDYNRAINGAMLKLIAASVGQPMTPAQRLSGLMQAAISAAVNDCHEKQGGGMVLGDVIDAFAMAFAGATLNARDLVAKQHGPEKAQEVPGLIMGSYARCLAQGGEALSYEQEGHNLS